MSDSDITQNFDGPVIEPVRGFGDVQFARADLDYFAAWANAIKKKRQIDDQRLISGNPALSTEQKSFQIRRAAREEIDLFSVMDLCYTPDGIKKILDDAMSRAGRGDAVERQKILKLIGPRRQQELAVEVCSEPRPSIDQLREAVRSMLQKTRAAVNVNAMTDEEIIAAVAAYQPPAATTADKSDDGGDNPLPGTPPTASGADSPSTGDAATPSSATSSTSSRAA